MADEIKFEASGFSSLKAQIREATLEYQALLSSVDATPAAIEAAAAKVAELKDQFDDANDAVNALTGAGKIQAFTKGLGAISGGFTAIQGAIALAGGDAKDFQKTMQKLQGAMALTQGLAQLEDLGNAFKNMKAVAVNAFNAIKTAIGSTGIGLLVIALGTIYAYWDDIAAAMSGVTAEQEKLNALSKANLATEQESLDTLNASDNILKEQGLSEKQIAQLKQKQTEEVIKAAEVNLANLKTTEKAQIEAAQRNKDILQGIIRFLTAPLDMLLYTVDQVGKALGQDFGLEEAFSGGLAKLVFDPEEVKKEGQDTIKEAEKQLLALKNQRAGYVVQIREIDKKAADQRAADQKKADEEAKKEEEKRQKEEKDRLEKNFKELQDAWKKHLEEVKQLREDTADALAVTEEQKRQKELTDLAAYYDDIIARTEQNGEDTKALYDAKFLALGMKNAEFIQQDKDTQDAANQKKLDDEKAYRDNLRSLVTDSALGLIGDLKSLNQQFDKNNEEAAKKAFEREKALSIAEAVISTYLSAQKAYASQLAIATPDAPFRATIAAAVAIASGLARVAIISSQKFQSSGSGGSAAGSGSNAKQEAKPSTYAEGGLLVGRSHDLGGIRTTMGELEGGEFVINKRATANFLPLLEALNAQGNTPGPQSSQMQQPIVKAYVVAGDMTSQQEADAKLSALARL